jgi:hypothetical protein
MNLHIRTSARTRARVRVCVCMYCPRQITWSLLARGWRGKLVSGEAQRTQLQPFSLRFKKVIWLLARICRVVSAMERIGVLKISNKIIYSKENDTVRRVIKRCDEDRQCTRTPNRVDVFGTCITLPGEADVSQAAAGPCRLHCVQC